MAVIRASNSDEASSSVEYYILIPWPLSKELMGTNLTHLHRERTFEGNDDVPRDREIDMWHLLRPEWQMIDFYQVPDKNQELQPPAWRCESWTAWDVNCARGNLFGWATWDYHVRGRWDLFSSASFMVADMCSIFYKRDSSKPTWRRLLLIVHTTSFEIWECVDLKSLIEVNMNTSRSPRLDLVRGKTDGGASTVIESQTRKKVSRIHSGGDQLLGLCRFCSSLFVYWTSC
jgi:hypothetical protein